jgi:hypothetical protein
MTRIKAPPKECEHCFRKFHPRKNENMDQWITRRFCSRGCNFIYQRINRTFKSDAKRVAHILLSRTIKEEKSGYIQVKEPDGEIDGVPKFKVRTIRPEDYR